jgi:hypothetical protein
MRRHATLLILTLLLSLFVVPALSQAASSTSPTSAKQPTVPRLAPRDDAEDEESEDGEEIEIDECEAGDGSFEFEDEEFEESEGEEEEFEIEFEECEEEAKKKKKKAGAVTAPEECRVRSAESSITTLPGSDRVQLTVQYLTYKPSTVSLDLKLKDGKGSLKIDSATKHLGKKGVLHLTTKVPGAVMDRATRAKEFDVALRAPQTPGYCGAMLEQKLSAKHPVGDARVYTQRTD